MKLPSYKNKNILILGLGLLGRGVKDAIFFAEKGANVTVTDLKTKEELKESIDKLKKYNIKYTLGEHKDTDILNADLIIRNAGIPKNSKYLKLAKKNNIPIDMDESLFAKYCPCPIIGITGTRGKTTTAYLTYEILKDVFTKKNIYIAGNIQGVATLPLLDQVTKNDIVILELSSWQLQGFEAKKISPRISVVTNIYEDHLNSYKNMAEYIKDKITIFKYQKKDDIVILNKKNAQTKKMAKLASSNITWYSDKDTPPDWQTKLQGKHNQENIAAALAIGKTLGLTNANMKNSIENFKGVPHRQEIVRIINEITFINDTTSTTPIAGQKALESFNNPIILIAGGATKNLDLSDYARDISKKVKAVILLNGTATPELEKDIIKFGGKNLIILKTDNLEEAIKKAYSISLPRDYVLLSPGCASFGLFKNEFDRGDQFTKIVNQL
jgi:UDP-N-acetylmuramoylalanine--D-glutamate ligase